jgi:hypothetical protein
MRYQVPLHVVTLHSRTNYRDTFLHVFRACLPTHNLGEAKNEHLQTSVLDPILAPGPTYRVLSENRSHTKISCEWERWRTWSGPLNLKGQSHEILYIFSEYLSYISTRYAAAYGLYDIFTYN